MTLKTERCHDTVFVVTHGTGGCHYNDRWCRPWQQSWHHDGSRFSVDEYDILLHAQKRRRDIPKLGQNWDDAGITDPALTQLNSGYGVFIGQIFNT